MGLFRTAAMVTSLPHALQPQVEAWTTSTLESLVWSDVLGVDATGVLSRAAAMAVPAVARARHLIAGAIAKLPLEAFRGADLVPDQPYWMYGTDGQLGILPRRRRASLDLMTGQSPWSRMLWTIDDHLFYGEALWLVTRFNAPDPSTGRALPTRMVRVPYDCWDIDADGAIVDPDGVPFPADAVRYIPGPHEGILRFAQRTIRAAGDLEQTAADVARRPFRLELHQTTDLELTDDEKAKLIATTRRALADNDGILFTNSALETKDHALNSEQLLLGARNASALDVARHVSMPAAMLDATSQGASLEYATLNGRNQQWLDYGLSLYLDAVASRLGMDDVLPAGQRAVFDLTDLTANLPSPTGEPTRD